MCIDIKNNTEESMESSPQPSTPSSPRLSRALLAALWMSFVALMVWFLSSSNAATIGIAILLAAVLAALLNYLIFFFTRRAKRGVKIATRVLAVLVSLLLLFSATVYTLAPTQLFNPRNDDESVQALAAYPNVEKLSFETDGRTVSGWMIHQVEGKAPLVLYFGGNGEVSANRVRRLIDSDTIQVFSGCNFAFLDYPGYGFSSGSPNEASLKQMGLDGYDAIASRADVDANRIVVFGFSMGTGVANYVASSRTPAGLMLFAPYADGYDLYNSIVPVFYGPMRALVAFRMESVRFAASVSVKPIVFASVDDEFVPFASSQRLADAYPAGCDFEKMQGLGHNDFWGSDAVLQRVSQYLAEVIDIGA